MKSIEERAAALLAKNAENTAVYATADGFLFFSKSQAEAHASRLQDRTVAVIERNNTEAIGESGDQTPETGSELSPAPEATPEVVSEVAPKEPENDKANADVKTKSSTSKNKKTK